MQTSLLAAALCLAARAAAAPVPPLPPGSNAQAAAAIEASLQAELDLAQAAAERVMSPDVRGYALGVKKSRFERQRRLAALLPELGLTPLPSAHSTALAAQAARSAQALRQMRPEHAERAYLEQQVDARRALLDDLDGFIAEARSPRLREYVVELRELTERELRRARGLRERRRHGGAGSR